MPVDEKALGLPAAKSDVNDGVLRRRFPAEVERPPVAGDDDVVDHRALQAWWTRGMGGRTWDATAGRYVASAGGWSDEQKRAAAEHINIDFYRVDEVPFHE
jgi:hypothetical protein